MDIGSDKEPRIQIDDAEPFPIRSVVADKALGSSLLRDIVGLDGRPIVLPPGAKITLYTGPSVVFLGRAQEDHTVLDMLSCEGPEDGEYVDF